MGQTSMGHAQSRGRESVAFGFPLRFSYNGYWDVFYWAFWRFNATVADIESGGDVAASVQFSGDRAGW